MVVASPSETETVESEDLVQDFYTKMKTNGWGFVVRDLHSRVRGFGASVLSLVTSASQAEIIVCEEATRIAID
jgi:hypothetical protein